MAAKKRKCSESETTKHKTAWFFAPAKEQRICDTCMIIIIPHEWRCFNKESNFDICAKCHARISAATSETTLENKHQIVQEPEAVATVAPEAPKTPKAPKVTTKPILAQDHPKQSVKVKLPGCR